MQVAELVAAGMSNREIAATLHMSTRTVEAHLTKIYRHYGVRSRSQLAGSLSQLSTDAHPQADREATKSSAARSWPVARPTGDTSADSPIYTAPLDA